jgi:hypothetical protein
MRAQSRNELGRASPHQHNSQHDLPLSIARDGPQLNTAAPTAAAAETARNVHSTRAPLARSRDSYTMEDAAVGAPRLATVVPGSLTRKGSTRIIGSLGANIAGQIPSRTRVVQGDQGKVQMSGKLGLNRDLDVLIDLCRRRLDPRSGIHVPLSARRRGRQSPAPEAELQGKETSGVYPYEDSRDARDEGEEEANVTRATVYQ